MSFQSDRNAIRNQGQKWASGRIPYVVSGQYSSQSRAVLANAIQYYHQQTCIRFTAATTNDADYIYIRPNTFGCGSEVGRRGGAQEVSLGTGCVTRGIAQHELMHVLGFYHEQSRPDRDNYVRINWQNIQSGMAYNFNKYSLSEVQFVDQYDYSSVMHYDTYAFSNGRGPTVTPLQSGAVIYGQRVGLSQNDLVKINKFYNCPSGQKGQGTEGPKVTEGTEGPEETESPKSTARPE